MQLKEVQKALSQLEQGPQSAKDALKQLKAATEKSLEYLHDGNTPLSQMYLEQGLTYLLSAFHYMNLDLEQVVQRQQERIRNNQNPAEKRVILIFSDHAELRVNGELRGTFPLYSEEDYYELKQIATLFSCRIEHSDHLQLDLFHILKNQMPS